MGLGLGEARFSLANDEGSLSIVTISSLFQLNGGALVALMPHYSVCSRVIIAQLSRYHDRDRTKPPITKRHPLLQQEPSNSGLEFLSTEEQGNRGHLGASYTTCHPNLNPNAFPSLLGKPGSSHITHRTSKVESQTPRCIYVTKENAPTSYVRRK